MSGLFWSLFGEEESAVAGDVKDTQPLNPPQRDRSLSAQFFSFFSDENEPDNAVDCNEVGAISDSPVAKTLSEMAQSLSEMADETIRTFSPAPVVPPVQPGKISYRRKTVFAPTGHLTEVLGPGGTPNAQLSLQNLAAAHLSATPNSTTTTEEESPAAPTVEPMAEVNHKFPSYRSVKEGKDVPLLTSLSRNRSSFKDRESMISQIATKTKSEQLETLQEQFTVSNLTGLPSAGSNKLSQLASISEHESHNPDPETPEISSVREESLPSVENHPGAIYKYDSDDYFLETVEPVSTKNIYTESDDDDVITADLDFEIFKPLPALTSDLDENIYFVNSNSSLNGDSEPLNLIGTLAICMGF